MMMFQSGQYCHCFPGATPVDSEPISNLCIFPPKYLSNSITSLDIHHHPISSYCIFFLGPIITSIHTCSNPPNPQNVFISHLRNLIRSLFCLIDTHTYTLTPFYKPSSKQSSDYVTLLLNTH